MAHFGALRDFRFEDQADDIRGAALYGRGDEKLGKIKDAIFDHSTGALKYVVVDAGGWLHSKSFLVPADRVRPRGEKDDDYVTELSKKQIENFPPYDESSLEDEKRWGKYETEYRGVARVEETGGVLHQAGSTNILVPDDLPAAIGSSIAGAKAGTNANAPSNMVDRSVGEAADIARSAHPREIVHHEDDRFLHADPTAAVEETIEGDAIFNSEDLQGRTHQPGNIHAADEPSYETVPGSPSETVKGRLPNYPDAGQGQRWTRFEENLRRQRPKIIGHCSVCEQFQNRHREDAA